MPFFLAFQCEEDNISEDFNTNLVVQNDSSFDLLLESVPNNIFDLPIGDSQYIEGGSSPDGFLLPSEFENINNIRIYRRDDDNNLQLVYEQSPIYDSLWVINESTTKDVDHILIINDDKLDE